jgi:hypothetical protein
MLATFGQGSAQSHHCILVLIILIDTGRCSPLSVTGSNHSHYCILILIIQTAYTSTIGHCGHLAACFAKDLLWPLRCVLGTNTMAHISHGPLPQPWPVWASDNQATEVLHPTDTKRHALKLHFSLLAHICCTAPISEEEQALIARATGLRRSREVFS